MKKYWVDFSGYLCVNAENEDEAERKFWRFINEGIDLSHGDLFDDVWDIDLIEERTDYGSLEPVSEAPSQQELEDFWNDK